MDYLCRTIPGYKEPVYLRPGTSDLDLFDVLISQDEYGYIRFDKQPEVILDAGANIGLSSVYFANKYPNAKIYAIEPENENYALLEKNTEKYAQITAIHGALMAKNGFSRTVDTGYGTLAFQVNYSGINQENGTIPCWNVKSFCKKYEIPKIDLLKLDIEGAEHDIFLENCEWLGMVSALVMEMHDRYKKGTNAAVFSAVKSYFDIEWIGGENYYFSKIDRAMPVIPDVYKTESPQPLPVERIWELQDELSRRINEASDPQSDRIDEIYRRIDKVEELYSRVDRVEELYSRVDKVEELYRRMDKVEELYRRMDKVEELYGRVDRVEELYRRMDKVEELYGRVDRVEELYRRMDKVEELYGRVDRVEELYSRVDKVEEIYRRMDKVEELYGRMDRVEELYSRVDKVEEFYERMDRVENLYQRMDKVEGLYPRVDSVEGLYTRVDSLEHVYPRIDALEGLFAKVDALEGERMEDDKLKLLAFHIDTLDSAVTELRGLMDKMEQGQTIMWNKIMGRRAGKQNK